MPVPPSSVNAFEEPPSPLGNGAGAGNGAGNALAAASRNDAARIGRSVATILVVDDNPTNLQVLIRILEGLGHRILVAKNGRAALDIARQALPDLVLLDVLMPDLDGFEVCRSLKADPLTSESVVIFLSALGDVGDKVSGLELGASDYVSKPFQAEEVLARVNGHLRHQRLEREVRAGRDRLDRELRSAGAMQRSLLPAELPGGGGASFFAHYQTSLYAGGDYYDVLPLGAGRFAIVVADVAGHGAGAAIVMAMLRTAVHSAGVARDDPAAVLLHLNDHFAYLHEAAVFATAIYAVLDAPKRLLSVALAGHPMPLLLRGGEVVEVECRGSLPLLIMPIEQMPVTRHALRAGDRLLFYSDGITEARGRGPERFELDRLEAALERHAASTPPDLLSRVVGEVDAFSDGREPEDDRTMLMVAIDAPT